MPDLPISHLLLPLVAGVALAMVLLAVPFWFICRKAGFSPWLTLLNCIPFGTVLLLYLLAFAKWKRNPMFVPAPPAPPDPHAEAQPASTTPAIARPS